MSLMNLFLSPAWENSAVSHLLAPKAMVDAGSSGSGFLPHRSFFFCSSVIDACCPPAPIMLLTTTSTACLHLCSMPTMDGQQKYSGKVFVRNAEMLSKYYCMTTLCKDAPRKTPRDTQTQGRLLRNADRQARIECGWVIPIWAGVCLGCSAGLSLAGPSKPVLRCLWRLSPGSLSSSSELWRFRCTSSAFPALLLAWYLRHCRVAFELASKSPIAASSYLHVKQASLCCPTVKHQTCLWWVGCDI